MHIHISELSNRLALALILILTPWILFGQESSISIRGRILDEDKQPLPSANVVVRTTDGKLLGGSAADTKGNFSIHNLPQGSHLLEVSFVGYTPHKQSIKLSRGQSPLRLGVITLKEDGKLLGDLVVSAKATEVVVRGDTLEYNADSFKAPEGSALEELIKRLPGAEIDESGQITINGKSISGITVDGKRFFESDPKVAIKNLPAELIEKVQVLDRQSDAARMTGFADGEEETILNLTVKPGRKQGLFGTAYLGGGTEGRYEGNAIVNRFTDGKQWSILAGANNTNNAGFSDIAADVSSSGLGSQMGGGARRFGPAGAMGGNSGITTSKILGGNLALTISSSSEIGGNAFLGRSDKEQWTKSETLHLISTGNTLENGETTELNTKHNYGTNLRLEWKPDKRTEIIIAPSLSYGVGEGTYMSQGQTTLESTQALITRSTLQQTSESKDYNGRLAVEASRRLSEAGRTLALSFFGTLRGGETTGIYQSDIYTASTDQSRIIDQRQENDSHSRSFRARLNYVEPLGKGYALQLTYQLRGEFSDQDRTSFAADASGAYTIQDATYSYDFSSTYLAHRAGVALKKATKASDLTLGVNIDPSRLESHTKSGGQERDIVQSVINYSPTLRYTYRPSRAFTLRVDYRGQSFQPSVNQLAPIQDVTNPLRVVVGNANLRPGYRHNLFGNLSLFSSAKQSSLNLFFFGRVVQNEIVASNVFDTTTGVSTTTYDNVNGSWGAGFGGFFNTPLPGKRFGVRIGTHNNLFNQIGFSQGEKNRTRTLSLNESLTLTYRHGWLDTSLGGSWRLSRSTNSLEGIGGQTTRTYGVNWDTNITLPLNLAFDSQLQYRKTSGYATGFNEEQVMLNLGLGYSFLKNKSALLRLKVYDVLGKQRSVFQNISAVAVTSQEVNTLGQYAMLQFIYRFNSFSGNASRNDMRGSGDMRMRGSGRPPGMF